MRVRLYEAGVGDRAGATVAFVDGPSVRPEEGPHLARATGATLTVLSLDPRREDCGQRLRVFTPARELPLSVEAAWCAAAARGEDSLVVEMGVTATAVRAAAGAFEAELPPPVLGQRAVEDRAAVAESLGIAEGRLDDTVPVLAGSCGVNVLVVAVRELVTLDVVSLHPQAWQRVMEKAKHVGALVVATEGGGREARFLGVAPSGLSDGTGCALALAPWALSQARSGAFEGSARYSLRGESGFGMAVDVTRDEAGGWAMRGAVRLLKDERTRW